MITVSVYGWEFRCQRNGHLECRKPESQVEDERTFRARNPKDIDFLDDHFSYIRDLILQLGGVFPPEQVKLPQVPPYVAPQPLDNSVHV